MLFKNPMSLWQFAASNIIFDRLGTSLAFVTQVCLVSSVGFAFTQCLWEALKRRSLSIDGIDAAFAATTSPISFLNAEMLFKIKKVSLLATIAW